MLNLLDDSILGISADLRQIALLIILLKAGLSLNLADLKKVGRPAVLMSCLPASCEILAFVLFAPVLLGINRLEAAVMGAVLAAVSPAVVVPRMVQLMESGYGTGKSIPQLVMAGASCDDIFVIVLFSTFVGMAQGGSVTLRVSNGQGASGDGTIRDPNVADGSVTGHHHTWVAWQDGKWICTVCNAVK